MILLKSRKSSGSHDFRSVVFCRLQVFRDKLVKKEKHILGAKEVAEERGTIILKRLVHYESCLELRSEMMFVQPKGIPKRDECQLAVNFARIEARRVFKPGLDFSSVSALLPVEEKFLPIFESRGIPVRESEVHLESLESVSVEELRVREIPLVDSMQNVILRTDEESGGNVYDGRILSEIIFSSFHAVNEETLKEREWRITLKEKEDNIVESALPPAEPPPILLSESEIFVVGRVSAGCN